MPDEVINSRTPCRVCGGSGWVAVKQFIDDGYGEVDSCPDCGVNDTIPRRRCLDKLTASERAIYDAVVAVETGPPDIRLTDAVCLLQAARESVADYVDGLKETRRLDVEEPWHE